jgi:Tfp pilus assembly protein PilW
MKQYKKLNESGFSLLEFIISMTLTLVLLGIASSLLASSWQIRMRENQRTDAMADAQRALNIMSREIANSGFGINDNGVVLADSNSTQIHFRANLNNSNITTNDTDENVTFTYQAASRAIVRYDPNGNPTTTSLADRITSMTITYTDYIVNSNSSITVNTGLSSPSANTSRVNIRITIALDPIAGQPASTVTLSSDIALRNSNYMLNRY